MVSISPNDFSPAHENCPSSAETGAPSSAVTLLTESVPLSGDSAGSSGPGRSVQETRPSGSPPVTLDASAQETSKEGIQDDFAKFYEEVSWEPKLYCPSPDDKGRSGIYQALPSERLHVLLLLDKQYVFEVMESWWNEHKSPSSNDLGGCRPLEFRVEGKRVTDIWHFTPLPSETRLQLAPFKESGASSARRKASSILEDRQPKARRARKVRLRTQAPEYEKKGKETETGEGDDLQS